MGRYPIVGYLPIRVSKEEIVIPGWLNGIVNILNGACVGSLTGFAIGNTPWFIARCEARKLPDTIPDERTGG